MTGFGDSPSGILPASFPGSEFEKPAMSPAERYHADDFGDTPSLSASIAKLLVTASPAHAFAAHPKLNPDYVREEKDRFDLGTCAHSLILEGVERVHIVHAENWTTKAAKSERDQARQAGQVPLLAKDWDRVRAMVAAADRQINGYTLDPRPFTGGKPEVPLTWEMNGVKCRALIDWLHDGGIAVSDYKSTAASAHPLAWPKTALGMSADVQIAMHSAGVEACFGVAPVWMYVVQETYPPYALSVITPDAAWLAVGRDKLEHALRIWRRCLETGDWPGYPPELARVEYPGWAEVAWLARSYEEQDAA